MIPFNQAITNFKLSYLITLVFLSVSQISSADEIGAGDITSSAASCTDCIDWRISGICFWLKCTPVGCDIETSIRVTHFLPDAVVSSYSQTNPWSEVASWNPTNGATLSDNVMDDQTDIDFKHVTVIGSPALISFSFLAETDYFCSSGETPYMPYFLSGLDHAGWHMQLPELFYFKSLSGDPAIGSDNGHWQALYPRSGWTMHPEDPKSAAITALRAAHIASAEDQPHIYQAMENDCGDGKKCWPPENVTLEGEDFKWQMLTPVAQDTAEAFGEVNLTGDSWANGKYTDKEQYAWHLWRKYSCCEPKGAFLFHIEFE